MSVLDLNFLFVDEQASFADQSSFSDLVKAIREHRRDLVVIVGAGVSADAGLPVWGELLDRMARSSMNDDQYKRFSELNAEPPERTASLILYQALQDQKNTNINELILRSLTQGSEQVPGMLASAIARLIQAYPGRASLITTNFDWILEKAIEECFTENSGLSSTSYSFDNWEEWVSLSDEEVCNSVMHLHGMLPRSVDPENPALQLGPIIFTEGAFLEHGSNVRKKLEELLADTIVIFVGIGLTDLNLISPLHRVKDSDGLRVAIHTPRLTHDTLSEEQCVEFASLRSQYFREKLNLQTAFTRTYSQVTQLVSELGLAAAASKHYHRRPGDGLHYNKRYNQVLRLAYSAVGADPRSGILDSDLAINVGWRLHEIVNSPKGPISLLNNFRSRRKKGTLAPSEKFGVFLWLNDLPKRPKGFQGIRLVATSAYVHWEAWSAFRVDRIEGTSKTTATLTAFHGKAQSLDIPHDSRDRMSWRGAFAVPLVAGSSQSKFMIGNQDLDQLQVGAISVNSTRPVVREDNPRENLSIISNLTESEMDDFLMSLYDSIQSLMV